MSTALQVKSNPIFEKMRPEKLGYSPEILVKAQYCKFSIKKHQKRPFHHLGLGKVIFNISDKIKKKYYMLNL
jgi:hypothetical protein